MSIQTDRILPVHPINGTLCEKLDYKEQKFRLKSRLERLDSRKLAESDPHGNSRAGKKRKYSKLKADYYEAEADKCRLIQQLIDCENALISITNFISDNDASEAQEIAESATSRVIHKIGQMLDFINTDL